MIITTVIAVALGLAPIDARQPETVVTGDYDGAVGRYSQRVDGHGVIHLRGFHPQTGALYEMTINPTGTVDGDVGEHEIHFNVRSAA